MAAKLRFFLNIRTKEQYFFQHHQTFHFSLFAFHFFFRTFATSETAFIHEDRQH